MFEMYQLVSKLTDVTFASWWEELVRSVLLPFDADAILSIPLFTRNMPNYWAWSGETSFSSSSICYQMIMTTKTQREN